MSPSQEPVSRFALNGDVRIHYVDSAPETTDRPPLLFVPGITDTVADYLDLLPIFGRRALVAELRGRGRSDAPPTGYGFAEHISDVAAVVADAGLDRFHLMTFSRGTGYALGWTVRNPGRVLTVSIGDYLVHEIRPEIGWAAPFVHGRWRGRPVRDRLAEVALFGIERDAQAVPMWSELAALHIPVQVIRAGRAGRDGRLGVTDEAIERYRATFPDVEVHTFEESEHDIFRPDPSRYPSVVKQFIDRHDPAAGPRIS